MTDHFVLFLDPSHKSAYQLDLNQPNPRIQGALLESSTQPQFISYMGGEAESLFWYDAGFSVIKRAVEISKEEIPLAEVEVDTALTGMAADTFSQKLYFSDRSKISMLDWRTGDVVVYHETDTHILMRSLNVYNKHE